MEAYLEQHCTDLWTSFTSLTQTDNIQDMNDIYKMYSVSLKITNAIQDDEIKSQWIDYLTKVSVTHNHEQMASKTYTFDTIVALANKKESQFNITCSLVTKDDDLLAIAKNMDDLSSDVFGITFGVDFYHKMMQSSNTYCLLFKYEDKIVGCVMADMIECKRENETVTIMHICSFSHRPEYPALNLIDLVSKCIDGNSLTYGDTTKTPDYISACVMHNYDYLIAAYEKYGFVLTEKIDQGFMGKITHLLLLKLTKEEMTPPSHTELKTSLRQYRFDVTGQHVMPYVRI